MAEHTVLYSSVSYVQNPDATDRKERNYSIAYKGEVLTTEEGVEGKKYIPQSEVDRLVAASPGCLSGEGFEAPEPVLVAGQQPPTLTSPESRIPERRDGPGNPLVGPDGELVDDEAVNKEAVADFKAMKASDLRELAEKHGVPTSGSKAEIAERLVAQGVVPLPEGAARLDEDEQAAEDVTEMQRQAAEQAAASKKE